MDALVLLGSFAILMLIVVMKLAELVSPLDMQAAVARYPAPAPDLNMQLVFLVSVVNGIFEELFVAGYIITTLTARRGMWMAINVSVVVRLLYFELYKKRLPTSCGMRKRPGYRSTSNRVRITCRFRSRITAKA